jgi:hypothetical protein
MQDILSYKDRICHISGSGIQASTESTLFEGVDPTCRVHAVLGAFFFCDSDQKLPHVNTGLLSVPSPTVLYIK